MKINLQLNDIRDVMRYTSRKDNSSWNLTVELANTLQKNNILSAIRKHNKENRSNQLNAGHLGLSGSSCPIYVSEFLTPRAKRIFFLAREMAKSEQYDYCWTANGKVYLRKKSGAPYILIKNEDQLKSLCEA